MVGHKAALEVELEAYLRGNQLDEYDKLKRRLGRELVAIIDTPRVGPEIAGAMVNFFEEPHNKEVMRDLFVAGVEPQDVEYTALESEVNGQTIVFTGSLEGLSRDEAKAQADKLGAKVASDVSRKTNLVVVGPNAGSKLTKAKDLGIRIIDEAEWLGIVARAQQ